jgi:hypothetical protein
LNRMEQAYLPSAFVERFLTTLLDRFEQVVNWLEENTLCEGNGMASCCHEFYNHHAFAK